LELLAAAASDVANADEFEKDAEVDLIHSGIVIGTATIVTTDPVYCWGQTPVGEDHVLLKNFQLNANAKSVKAKLIVDKCLTTRKGDMQPTSLFQIQEVDTFRAKKSMLQKQGAGDDTATSPPRKRLKRTVSQQNITDGEFRNAHAHDTTRRQILAQSNAEAAALEVNQVVFLTIPKQYISSNPGDLPRMPCRIEKVHKPKNYKHSHTQYSLSCVYGMLEGQFTTKDLCLARHRIQFEGAEWEPNEIPFKKTPTLSLLDAAKKKSQVQVGGKCKCTSGCGYACPCKKSGQHCGEHCTCGTGSQCDCGNRAKAVPSTKMITRANVKRGGKTHSKKKN